MPWTGLAVQGALQAFADAEARGLGRRAGDGLARARVTGRAGGAAHGNEGAEPDEANVVAALERRRHAVGESVERADDIVPVEPDNFDIEKGFRCVVRGEPGLEKVGAVCFQPAGGTRRKSRKASNSHERMPISSVYGRF
mgnify:CR=1 FL=1